MEAPDQMLCAAERQLFGQPLAGLVTALRSDVRLRSVWKAVERDYGDAGLTLARVARIAGVSRDHLNVLLHLRTGLTFHKLLIHYRLFQALRAIQAEQHGLLDIALAVGFGSLRPFERNFVRMFGFPPRDWKGFSSIK
jgi:transcriptional regulator GlxA family with amidase domain